ncbi:hypothetical protein [Acinetobacter baumannii]|uniref:hypothetical protein n=1 Tax=Acinetobacter baumannii TaxID=470 RepID=UPI0015C534D7|nr:hypothetical protein [Acinetobacter baumannii]
MDNYKIKVKDEQDFKEVASLVNMLGYGINFSYSNASGEVVKGLFLKSNGFVEWTHRDTYFDFNDSKELTLPQLRDLVVLKRNDVRDATHTHNGCAYYVGSDLRYTFDQGGWHLSAIEMHLLKPIHTAQAVLRNLDELREEYKDYHKDPALISGAEALRALADGKEVEYNWLNQKSSKWMLISEELKQFNLYEILSGTTEFGAIKFRLKPQTIKLDLEIPAPYKAKIGGRDDTSFVLNVGRHQYCYKTEEDYTKARDALEAVFDAALRGTNS